MIKDKEQLKKDEVNRYPDGRPDRLVKVVINGKMQRVSQRWFEEIFAISTGKD